MNLQVSFWGVFFLSLGSITTFLWAVIFAAPFFYQIYFHSDLIFSKNSYLGEKLVGSLNMKFFYYLYGLITNIYRNLISFNIRGDGSFRYTIPNHPHLDLITGIFFIIGWYFLLKFYFKTKEKQKIKYLIISFFLVQIPSILDIKNLYSTPNIGRMIGVMPISYIIAAYGIYKTGMMLNNIVRPKYFFPFICAAILIINFYLYFIVYPKTLPNRNTAFGRIIASKIDQYPSSVRVIMISCCWGEHGQPEPNGVFFSLKKHRNTLYFEKKPEILNLISLSEKTVVVTSPTEDLMSLKPKKRILLKQNDWNVAYLYEFF